MRLVKASEMQEMDRKTIQELGIPGIVLMENAGRGAAHTFLSHFSPEQGARVIIICGRGNNGGDGYVVGRYLHEAGLRPTIMVLSEKEKISGDARMNLDIIHGMGLDIRYLPNEQSWQDQKKELTHCNYLVDAILGTGLNSPVRGYYGAVIDEINSSGKPVMAIDIPSGLNADNGAIMGLAVRADLTVTFGLPKLGQLVFPGCDMVGRLVRIDICIPHSVAQQVPEHYRLVTPEDFAGFLMEGKKDIHKGHRGHLLILAGSPGKTGAATLAALGAVRAGAGLVTVGTPESLNPILEEKLTEAMTAPLPQTPEGTLSMKALPLIKELMEGKTALAIGPGLSTNPETVELVKAVCSISKLPMVIDADGLNALVGSLDLLSGIANHTVLTPHPGEMGRLIGKPPADIQSDRISTALDFVNAHGCYLVLKGARTLIALPEGKLYVNPTGNPALSSGGAGDVLTGLIGGFLARRWPVEKATIAGTYIHGLAADLIAEEMGTVGIMAGELLEVVPGLINSLYSGNWPLQGPPPHLDLV
ncbi:MAG: bifunctional ADP-dependent NAD(P)H-hydrate dehydratase/NAD(P)H-hydrate epimerase [Deltaproteobacteria bacterium]|nr:MAG: bifunctional ADP-dependent NAD(P)H-hydrate dehydratase/NAD(P)H-hydrate epimerase [Deltaproteobacteria bacterium]